MKNNYQIVGNISFVYLNRKDGTTFKTMISTSNLSRAQEFEGSWNLLVKKNGKRYAVGTTKRNGKRTTVSLHRRLSLDCPQNFAIDHVNNDGLNNTRENLRVCTPSENGQNRKGLHSTNRSGCRNVHWDRANHRWQVRVTLNGKRKHIGSFIDLEEAKLAAQIARHEIDSIRH
jgi:hypothetical protein